MARRFRRIVTGHDDQGRSVILFDGEAPNVMVPPTEPLVAMTDLWRTHATPASNAGQEDAAAGPITLPPPKGGTVFRMVELPPDAQRNYANLKAIDTEGARVAGQRHPGFHKTNSLDYIIVIEGEVWALLDTGETLLRTGDVLIQRGTSHAWSNRSDKRVILAGIMLDAPAT
jgi:quercetin dioxygenase-like cupin family protein